MSKNFSPEQEFLGKSLIKEIDKVPIPENDMESRETEYQTLDDKVPSKDSLNSCEPFFPPHFNNTLNTTTTSQPFFAFLFNKDSLLSVFKDQKSTIILQKTLKSLPKDIIDKIIDSLCGSWRTIIKNKNGNYFASDLIKEGNKSSRMKILTELSNTICDDCVDEFGTHPIQVLIELSTTKEEYDLILKSFKDFNKILMASMSQNGTYVVQKLIKHIPENFRSDFNSIFAKYICVLSIDSYGVCAFLKFINYTNSENTKDEILKFLLTNFVNISSNKYGNYLIQTILEKWWNSKQGQKLKEICIQKFHVLAINHFSSYVCDVFLKFSNYEEKSYLWKCLSENKLLSDFNLSNTGRIIINKLINAINYSNYFININPQKKDI